MSQEISEENVKPDRIWAWPFNSGWGGGYYRCDNLRPLDEYERSHGAEYVRIDLVEKFKEELFE